MADTSYLDFHTHLLPGLDDGAFDWDDAMKMARVAASDGTRWAVATPHRMERVYTATRSQVLEMCRELQERLEAAGVPLQVIPGMEVQMDPGLASLLDDGELVTIGDGGSVLLVELPFNDWPQYVEEVVFRLQLRGITVVLAHPERNRVTFEKPEFLEALVERGVLCQVNTGSLLGWYGSRVRSAAERLLRKGLVHLLGSDAHSPYQRPPQLSEAVGRLERLAGRVSAQAIARDNALKLLGSNPATAGIGDPEAESHK